MAWANGGAGSKIPTSIKRQVRARQNNQCTTYNPQVCTGGINEFDHVIPIAELKALRRDANNPDNIQGLCFPCHKHKTQVEAQQGRRRHLRPPPPHPSDAA